MKKCMVLLTMVLAIAGLAGAGYAAEYDRYERGYRVDSPPPPPPSSRRAADVPPQRHAQYNQPYIGVQLGFYTPNDDRDGLDGYDTGGNFNVMLGARMSPFFAVEGSVGGFVAERDSWGDDEVSVIPLTLGARLIMPNPVIEPYIGGGFGIYFSSLDEPSSGIDDDSSDFGGYLSLGLDFWLSPQVALNFEGRYQWIEAEFDDVDVDLSGWTANIGVRVTF